MEHKIITKIDNFIKKENIPNLLFHGSNHELKYSAYTHFLNKIYKNNENIKKYVLYINCVSIKGIKTIKENIKLFSMQIINKKSNIFFKTIILEHGEYLTYDSQYSLRRTIEQFSHNTRFILLCENQNYLLNPILSRFVHIYIPSKINCTPYHCDNSKYTKLCKHMKTYKKMIDNDVELYEYCNLAHKIYDDNIFAYELLDKFKKSKNYHVLKIVIKEYFINFRNEILCIFYVLNIFRNNQKYEIYDLY